METPKKPLEQDIKNPVFAYLKRNPEKEFGYKPKVISKRFCWVYISWFSESPGNASFVALGVRTGQKPKLCTLLAAVHMSGALKSSCADTHSPAFGPFPSIGFTSAFQEQA